MSEISIKDFFTREAANEGIEIPLSLPDGTKTDHWIRIRSVDSDEFRKRDMDLRRELFANTKSEASQIDKKVEMFKPRLLASLICGWSFDLELSEENKIQLIIEAPQIADKIDSLCEKRALFVKKKLPNSAESQESTSSSTDR